MIFRPMLADTLEDMSKLRYPVLASNKLDGLRAVILHGQPLTRNLKPIGNHYVRSMLEGLPCFDGELIVGNYLDPTVWNKSQSGIRSSSGEPDWHFHIFDLCGDEFRKIEFAKRYEMLQSILTDITKSADWMHLANRLHLVPHEKIENEDQLRIFEHDAVSRGFEGAMVRDLAGPYKCGRSTLAEGFLLKVKRFHDTEAVIIGLEEEMANLNEATTNAMGLTERASVRANKRGKSTMGALVCRVPGKSETFKIGTGFTAQQRAELWEKGQKLVGQVVTFKYFSISDDGIPRFPVFMRIRPDGS